MIDVPDEHQGVVIEKMARRKGELTAMHNTGTGIIRLEFEVPTRGLIGYRNEFLTDTRGLGIMASRFVGYGPLARRHQRAQPRLHDQHGYGRRDRLYAGKPADSRAAFRGPDGTRLCGHDHRRALAPRRPPLQPDEEEGADEPSANSEVAEKLDVPRRMSLDQALEWIADDELVEITPQGVRVRKAILNADERRKRERQKDAQAAVVK